jgi:hypothetical protein
LQLRESVSEGHAACGGHLGGISPLSGNKTVAGRLVCFRQAAMFRQKTLE